MKECFLVGVGGMLGCIARYLCGGYILQTFPNARIPWGTLFVNLLGCLLIGVLAGISERYSQFNSEIRLAGITGFLGGFTTFSAFGIETLQLFREGALMMALFYTVGSITIGVLCAYVGLKLAM